MNRFRDGTIVRVCVCVWSEFVINMRVTNAGVSLHGPAL